jgi:3-phenylpropionate/trans-cinnamate dioxygenase ferredoxin subunit
LIHDLGPVSQFPIGGVKVVEVGKRSIGVFNLEGRFYALRNVCPHEAAPVCLGQIGGTMLPSRPQQYEFGMDGHVLRCPWHGWEFDITTGKTLFDVDDGRIVTYPVRVEADRLLIELKS